MIVLVLYALMVALLDWFDCGNGTGNGIFSFKLSKVNADSIFYKTEGGVNFGILKQLQEHHEYKIKYYYGKRQRWITSNLGYTMFKNTAIYPFKRRNKTFIIYLWKSWYSWFQARHVSNHVNKDPLYVCSVKNCKVTNDSRLLPRADAVLIHVQPGYLPRWPRKPFQRWVYLSDESPKNMFSTARRKPNLSEWANYFNWTMTYRTDSDVPVPYGRTIPLPIPTSQRAIPESISTYVPHWEKKRRDVPLASLMSSCHVKKRMDYIKQLQKYIAVDVYGKCSYNHKTSCPGRYKKDCPIINDYLFYLAFENSGCRQYISEKTFFNSFSKGAIPIIMGPPREDCNKLLPPLSYIHTDNFASPKHLSDYLHELNANDTKLLIYHQWRRFFKVVNEHGYSGTKSYSICRLCEALNYNDAKPKVYSEDDLRLFAEFKLLCKY